MRDGGGGGVLIGYDFDSLIEAGVVKLVVAQREDECDEEGLQEGAEGGLVIAERSEAKEGGYGARLVGSA
jgi:hypothetical protein